VLSVALSVEASIINSKKSKSRTTKVAKIWSWIKVMERAHALSILNNVTAKLSKEARETSGNDILLFLRGNIGGHQPFKLMGDLDATHDQCQRYKRIAAKKYDASKLRAAYVCLKNFRLRVWSRVVPSPRELACRLQY